MIDVREGGVRTRFTNGYNDMVNQTFRKRAMTQLCFEKEDSGNRYKKSSKIKSFVICFSKFKIAKASRTVSAPK